MNKEESLGKKLKELREERGWSQAKLAMKSGVSRSHISLIELERIKHPRAGVLINLARALDIHEKQLYEAAGYIKEAKSDYDLRETPEQVLDNIKLNVRRLEKMLENQKEEEKEKNEKKGK